jgi:predicted dehydrogenase
MHILIIGVGSIGERHLRNFLGIPGVKCSIAETNERTLQKIVAEYHVHSARADYRDYCLGNFDGVVISIPTHLHILVAQDALKSGANVLLEKPLAMSMEGVEELKKLHSEKRTVLAVAYSWRSDPLLRELRELALTGEAGRVRLIDYYVGQYWPLMRKNYPPQYAQSRATGGGAIPDQLIHMINFLEWCFGPPLEVSASQWRLGLEDISTEDTAHMVLKFYGDIVACLGICLFQRNSTMRLQIIGDKSTIQLRDDSDNLEIFDPGGGTWLKGKSTRLDRDMVFKDQAQHFIECIKGNAVPRCTLEEAEQTLHTMLAALQSSDSDGRFVKYRPA